MIMLDKKELIMLGEKKSRTVEDAIEIANCMGFTINDDNKELYREWIAFTGDERIKDELARFRKHYSNMLWLFMPPVDILNRIYCKKYGNIIVYPRSKFKELDGYSVIDVKYGSSTYKFYEFFELNGDELVMDDEDDLEEEIQREFFIKLVEASDPRRVYNLDDRSGYPTSRIPTKMEVVMKNDTHVYGIAGNNRAIRVK